MHWSQMVQAIRSCRLELARLDPHRGMPLSLPAGATERDVAAVESKIQRPLPPAYRAFLRQHDGWPQLFGALGLFGTRHLWRGTYVGICRLVLEGLVSDDSTLLPIGIDADGQCVVALQLDGEVAEPCCEGTAEEGEVPVILCMNDVATRLASFPELLSMMLEMTRAAVDELRVSRRLGREVFRPNGGVSRLVGGTVELGATYTNADRTSVPLCALA